jgi:hypothetical protein
MKDAKHSLTVSCGPELPHARQYRIAFYPHPPYGFQGARRVNNHSGPVGRLSYFRMKLLSGSLWATNAKGIIFWYLNIHLGYIVRAP